LQGGRRQSEGEGACVNEELKMSRRLHGNQNIRRFNEWYVLNFELLGRTQQFRFQKNSALAAA
jgi:hypothetical protein